MNIQGKKKRKMTFFSLSRHLFIYLQKHFTSYSRYRYKVKQNICPLDVLRKEAIKIIIINYY